MGGFGEADAVIGRDDDVGVVPRSRVPIANRCADVRLRIPYETTSDIGDTVCERRTGRGQLAGTDGNLVADTGTSGALSSESRAHRGAPASAGLPPRSPGAHRSRAIVVSLAEDTQRSFWTHTAGYRSIGRTPKLDLASERTDSYV